MIKINNFPEINGEQLRAELLNAGITINKSTPYISNNELVIDVLEGNADLVEGIVANHIVKPIEPPTVLEKLSAVGLTVDDLKTALGLGGN